MTSHNDDGLVAITIAGYPFDRVQGLGSSVPVEGCETRFERAPIGDMNSHVFAGPRTREVTEIDPVALSSRLRERRVPCLHTDTRVSAAGAPPQKHLHPHGQRHRTARGSAG